VSRDDLPDRAGNTYALLKSLTLYDCAAKKTAILNEVTYARNGEMRSSQQYDEEPPVMRNVVPGTVGERVFSFVCDPERALNDRIAQRVDEEFRVNGKIKEVAFAQYIFGLKDCPIPSVSAPQVAFDDFSACGVENDKLRQHLISTSPF
jgi:hypothetical protein